MKTGIKGMEGLRDITSIIKEMDREANKCIYCWKQYDGRMGVPQSKFCSNNCAELWEEEQAMINGEWDD